MVKTITKIGDSVGLIFDEALLAQAKIKPGDRLTVTVHENGSILLTPLRPVTEPNSAAVTAKRLIGKNSELFRRLS